MNKLIGAIFTPIIACVFISCNGLNEKERKLFENHSVSEKRQKQRDSVEIVKLLKQELTKHSSFFESKEFNESTAININAILYSPKFKKMAIFIIIKNATSRQLKPGPGKWYYDGTCYLGIRKEDSLEVSFAGPSYTNSVDSSELSVLMRKALLAEYATAKDTNGNYRYKYNIGEPGFWNCPIWDEIEAKKLQAASFKFKKEQHPENVYEPKH